MPFFNTFDFLSLHFLYLIQFRAHWGVRYNVFVLYFFLRVLKIIPFFNILFFYNHKMYVKPFIIFFDNLHVITLILLNRMYDRCM